MARNVYGGYCRECGRWTPPGFGHFERYRGGWRIHCVECASGRKLPPEGDQVTLDEVLDVIAENPHRFIEQYEVYREEVIRLGGKL